jgi:hypothetical protein
VHADALLRVRARWQADTIPSVGYKSQTFTRNTLNTGGVLVPLITNAAQVNVLATANCTDSSGTATACNGIAQTTGTSFPWARSPARPT